jgi:hypothetical protein
MPFVVKPPRLGRAVPTALATAVAVALTAAGPAAAATAAPDACVSPAFRQVFLPWNDAALYTKSPGGDFEGALSNWSLNTGARVVAGNESFYVGAPSDRSSLSLAAGSRAVSSPMCIDRTYPSFRFFARNLSAGKGDLQVEVLWEESGVRRTSKAGLDKQAGVAWTPVKSLRLPTGALSTGRLEPVTFRFTAVGGAWQVDDLYVDPFMRR